MFIVCGRETKGQQEPRLFAPRAEQALGSLLGWRPLCMPVSSLRVMGTREAEEIDMSVGTLVDVLIWVHQPVFEVAQ